MQGRGRAQRSGGKPKRDNSPLAQDVRAKVSRANDSRESLRMLGDAQHGIVRKIREKEAQRHDQDAYDAAMRYRRSRTGG